MSGQIIILNLININLMRCYNCWTNKQCWRTNYIIFIIGVTNDLFLNIDIKLFSIIFYHDININFFNRYRNQLISKYIDIEIN